MDKKIIWIASYPKSGNTWIRSIISNILFSNDYVFDFELLKNIIEFDLPKNYNFLLKKNNQDFYQLNKIEVISKYWIEAQKNYNLKKEKKFFKTHSANIGYLGNPYTSKDLTKGVIYLIRDPRDVVISYSKHLNKKIDEVIFLMEQTNAITYTAKGNYPVLLSRWDHHIKSWANLKVPKIVIKYENLLENTHDVIKQLIMFLNNRLDYDLKINETNLQKIIKNTSFNNLKSQETCHGFPEATNNSPFFRLGEKNQWQNNLSIKQQQRVYKLFKDTMDYFGYS